MSRNAEMTFSRRMLLAITPVGVAIGLYEAWHLAGGLVFLMVLQITLLTAVLVGVVRVIRRESAQQEKKP